MQKREYVGFDLHRRRSVIVRVDEHGEHVSTVRIDNDAATLASEVAKAGEQPEVVLEATYGWYWAVDVLQEIGATVHLASGRPQLGSAPAQGRRAWRQRSGRHAAPGPSASRGSPRRPHGSCASWSAIGPSWLPCARGSRPRCTPCWPQRACTCRCRTCSASPGSACWTIVPGWFTRKVFNPAIARLTKWGLSMRGSRVLEVRGRSSGEMRTTVVNLLTVDGVRYLVAPRGETQWVRNLRAAGTGTLRVGKRTETFTATELPDEAKPPVIRAYLKAWARETRRFFEGLTADSPDADVAAVAAGFPAFRIE